MTREQFMVAFSECEIAFHRNWGAAHDGPGYDKRAWQDLHNSLITAWRNHATQIGIPRDQPLVAAKEIL